MHTRRIVSAVAVVLLLGTAGAMAQTMDEILTPTIPQLDIGDLYRRSDLLPTQLQVVPLPQPVYAEPGPTALEPPRAETSLDHGELGGIGGSALVSPRGGAVFSPKQRADRQIRQLIRRLD